MPKHPPDDTRRSALRRILGALLWLLASATTHGAVYYVNASQGNDGLSGLSVDEAFATIQRAHDVSLPGDIVNILNGVYSDPVFTGRSGNLVTITRSGAPGAPIVYQNYPGHSPELRTNGTRLRAVFVRASYITIRGLRIVGHRDLTRVGGSGPEQDVLPYELTIPGTMPDRIFVLMHQSGIGMMAPSSSKPARNIEVLDCTISHCAGSAIAIEGGAGPVDYVAIRGNRVFENNQRNNWGGSAINLLQLTPADDSRDTKIFVENNVCYNNENLLRWVRTGTTADGWSDGNGIIYDVSPNYTGRVRIQNNLCYNNGGAGIAVTKSANADVWFNTLYHNARSQHLTNWVNLAITNGSTGESVRGNIIWCRANRPLFNSATGQFRENLVYKDGVATAPALPGVDNRWGHPRLLREPSGDDTSDGDFRLAADSPAIDAVRNIETNAYDGAGRQRPQDGNGDGVSKADYGAFEAAYPATLSDPISGGGSARLGNLSCLSDLKPQESLIVGFRLSGSGKKTLLLRAVGPTLGSAFGVPLPLGNPRLLLFRNQERLAENDDWRAADTAALAKRVGAFDLPVGSADAALSLTLDVAEAANYTAHISGGSTQGTVLVEIYDASSGGDTARLTNLSVLGRCASPSRPLVLGFVLAGSGACPLVLRAAGPSLAGFGVPAAIRDPNLALRSASGALLVSNEDWSSHWGDSELGADFARLGAFPFSPGSLDAALRVILPASNLYTVQVFDRSGQESQALVEAYENR